jgi:hypothetical protein
MSTFVFAYTDEHGIANDCTNNWNIGIENSCVGCNKASGLKDNTWVVMKKLNGRYNLGFTGNLIQKHDTTFQPWEIAGGKHWNHIYECSHNIWLGDMDDFCTHHGFDRTMFIKTLMFGHPNKNFKDSFNQLAAIVRNQYA